MSWLCHLWSRAPCTTPEYTHYVSLFQIIIIIIIISIGLNYVAIMLIICIILIMSLMLLWCDVSLQLFPMIMTLLCHMILLIYASAENWKDSNGRDMAPGRFWNSGIETTLWPQFPPTIQALVWGLNWIYGSRPRCIHFNWNIFIHTMSVSSLYIIMIFIVELIFIAFCRYESYDVK